MHEADDAYSIQSTWSCYWLDQFLTLALNTLILSIFFIFHWICLPSILLILVGVELPLCVVCSCHSILECCIMFSGIKLSMGSFVLFIIIFIDIFVHPYCSLFLFFFTTVTTDNGQSFKVDIKLNFRQHFYCPS